MQTKDVSQLKTELLIVENRIKRVQPHDSHIDSLSRSFHLGMVGGSGKNNYRLNKRKEAYLDRTIQAARILTDLYSKRDNLQNQIEDIESGKAEKKALAVIELRQKRAQMWRDLKAGDELPLGNPNGNPTIKRKNRLSVETDSGSKWTASEIIGKEAARLI